MRTFVHAALVSMALAPLAAAGQQQPAGHQHAASGHEQLGTVDFATSCAEAAKPEFNRAVALLHSFEFGDAIKGFNGALAKDPSCAMAEWGVAMSRWGNPFNLAMRAPGPLKEGQAAVDRAKALKPATPREQAYVDAVAMLFASADTVDQRTRIVAYRDAMAKVAAANPADVEAQVFYALSIAGSHTPSDKTYANLLKAAAILEGLIAKYPQHPGLAHYIIHSYDVPALADRALVAARRYASIAPSAPHALHMPSHTFTRVGSWQESIDTNIASANAARALGATAEELHAMDYQAYAALQSGQDALARDLVAALPAIKARFDPQAIGGAAPGSSGSFAMASMPARYALERGDWKGAAALPVTDLKAAHADSLTRFARGIGMARSGDLAGARAEIDALKALKDSLDKSSKYWAARTEEQMFAVSAWIANAEGDKARAEQLMKAAADGEDASVKNVQMENRLYPLREMYADLLLENGKAAGALANFKVSLAETPNRYRGLYGAAMAAHASGDKVAAMKYYDALVALSKGADGPRPELARARERMALR